MNYILKIGNLDVSAHVEAGYSIQKTPVFDTSTAFTNMLGQEVKDLIGHKVSISANLGQLTATEATAVCTACSGDNITVTFGNPFTETATFRTPSLTMELTSESPEEYDISISMETDTISLYGL